MATLKQYEFYKLLFDEENSREKQLRESAKNYLSLATLYSAFVIFAADSRNGIIGSHIWVKALFVAAIVFMAVSFLLSLWVTQVSDYEAITEPRDVTEQFGDDPMEDEEFYDYRIADFTVACERNSIVNNKKATFLGLAGYALLFGIFLHAGSFVARFV